MCTLSYYPLGNQHYVMTSNRDESIKRKAASLPLIKTAGKMNVLMPVDGEQGGSWFGVNHRGRTACLLNGAFQAHIPKGPYRKSRGLVLTDALFCSDMEAFYQSYPLTGIEPFTLVVADPANTGEIITFIWDGNKRYRQNTDAGKAHIWSSAMLYPEAVRNKTATRFEQLLSKNRKPDAEVLRQFHEEEKYRRKIKSAGLKPYEFLMTMAIASVEVLLPTKIIMHYDDLQNGEKKSMMLPLMINEV